MPTPTFGLSPVKADARRATVVDPWRALSGSKVIPPKKQYLTLGGPLAAPDDPLTLQPVCELLHMTEGVGLIRSEQYHSIDWDEDVHAANRALVERHYSPECRPRLYCGGIIPVLDDLLGEGSLRPAIVNIDLMCGPKEAVHILARVLSILNRVEGSVLVTWNMVVEHYHQDFRPHLCHIGRHHLLAAVLDGTAWSWQGYLEYPGTNRRATTTMRSYVLWRPQ